MPPVAALTLSSAARATLFGIMSWRCWAQSEHGIARPATIARTGLATPRVPSRFVLEFDWRGLRLDEDTWSGSKVNRLIGEFLG